MINDINKFREQARKLFEIEIACWESGTNHWDVNNQFDEDILRSALGQLDNMEAFSDAVIFFQYTQPTTMDLANYLSTFNAVEINRAWVD